MSKSTTRSAPGSASTSTGVTTVIADEAFEETRFALAEDDPDFNGFAPTQSADAAAALPVRMAARRARRLIEAHRRSSSGHHTGGAASEFEGDAIGARARDPSRHGAGDRWYAATLFGDEAPARPGRPAERHRSLSRLLSSDVRGPLPLLLCVAATVVLIAALLPLFDTP